MKKCPFCAEEIQDEARKCKHCGEFLTPKEAGDDNITTTGNRVSFTLSGAVIGFLVGFVGIWGGCGKGDFTSLSSDGAVFCALAGVVVAILGAILGAVLGSSKEKL